jgi:hypothetical protein
MQRGAAEILLCVAAFMVFVSDAAVSQLMGIGVIYSHVFKMCHNSSSIAMIPHKHNSISSLNNYHTSIITCHVVRNTLLWLPTQNKASHNTIILQLKSDVNCSGGRKEGTCCHRKSATKTHQLQVLFTISKWRLTLCDDILLCLYCHDRWQQKLPSYVAPKCYTLAKGAVLWANYGTGSNIFCSLHGKAIGLWWDDHSELFIYFLLSAWKGFEEKTSGKRHSTRTETDKQLCEDEDMSPCVTHWEW